MNTRHLKKLVELLLTEYSSRMQVQVPEDDRLKAMYESLISVREPGLRGQVDEEYIKLEEEYLRDELSEQGILDVKSLVSLSEELGIKPKAVVFEEIAKQGEYELYHSDRIYVTKGDLFRINADAIVVSGCEEMNLCSNIRCGCMSHQLLMKTGVKLRTDMADSIVKDGIIGVGEARAFEVNSLSSKYVINAVGPTVRNYVSDQEERELTSCYQAALDKALKAGAKIVAVPVISSGEKDFPKIEGFRVALQAVDEYLDSTEEMKVIFVLRKEGDINMAKEIAKSVAKE